MRITENGVARFLVGGGASAGTFAALCDEHAVPAGMVHGLRVLLQRITESAQRVTAGPSDPRAMVEESLRHKQIVDEYRKALKATLKAVPDLPRFAAGVERALRVASGGGSISSRLFTDEVLENVVITGTKAWATRRMSAGQLEDVGFVRRKDGWYIRLLAKRRG